MDTSFKKVSSFFIEKNEKTAYWVREDFANDMTNKGLISQSIQLLSHVQLFATPGTAVCQAALFTNSWSLLKLMSIELVMPSNHFILCRPLLLLPSIFPNIRVFQWYSIYIYISSSYNPTSKEKNIKNGQKNWIDISPGGNTDGQQTHEKMLNIASHQGNANRNYTEISPHTYQNGYHQREHKEQILVRMWKRGTLLHSWWECKWAQPLRKAIWRFPKKLKRTTIWPSNSTPGCTLSKNEHANLKRYMYPNAHSTLFTIAKIQKQPTCPSTDGWNCGVYIHTHIHRFPRWC